MQIIRIGRHRVGTGQKPFIVAEAGINHNGKLEYAYRMIRAAKTAGASAIKFQTFRAEEFVADPKQSYTYHSRGKRVTESMLTMFKRYEFSKRNWRKIKERCDREKITFLSTPQNKSDLDFLLTLKIPAIKVGSDDFTNTPLLTAYAKTKLPMIVSCGMSDLKEVRAALKAVGALNGYPAVLLLCTSEYPTPPESVNLLKLQTLRREFPRLPLGFSDHTQGPLASSLAVGFEACVFEKHFTLSHSLPGPDHWFSEDLKGLKLWVESIKTAHQMMGSPIVKPTKKELKNKKEFQRVIVAQEIIKKNDLFNAHNLGMRRVPKGRGLAPGFLYSLLGKRSTRNYKPGDPIHP